MPWGLLGALLVPLEGYLGASWGSLGALLGPSWGPLGALLGLSWGLLGPLGALLEAPLVRDANLIDFGYPFGTQKSPQEGPKMEPEGHQNR